jgi:hypothetical protein
MEDERRCISICRFLSESGFSEFKDSQDSAGRYLHVCLMFAAAGSCESLNSENPDSDRKRQIEMRPTRGGRLLREPLEIRASMNPWRRF